MPNAKQFKTKEEYNEWFRKYREKNAEKFRNYNREYNRVWRRDFGYGAEEKSIAKYPKKVLARQFFNYAVRTGKIKRENCSVCGKPNAQGHHDDYSKPLKIKWFCPLHHTEYHKLTKSKKGVRL